MPASCPRIPLLRALLLALLVAAVGGAWAQLAHGAGDAPAGASATIVPSGGGERVVGRGRAVGTVYQLEDGRTIVVREPRGEG